MESKTLTRAALYDLVWSKSLTILAKEFSYSVNGLRKICIVHNIPLPKAGYWSKIKFGKNPLKPVLTGNLTKNIQLPKTKKAINFKTSKPTRMSKPHPLIKEAKISLEMAKPMQYSYSSPNMVTTGKGQLNITVTPKLINHALFFMNVLIKEFELRGHSVGFKNYYGMVIIVQTIKFQFSLRERSNRFKKSDVPYESYQ